MKPLDNHRVRQRVLSISLLLWKMLWFHWVSLGFIGFHWNFIGIRWSKRVPCWFHATSGWILGFLWTLWIPHPHKSTLTCAAAEAMLVLWWLKLYKCSFYRATILLNLNTVFDKSFWDTASFSPHPQSQGWLGRYGAWRTHCTLTDSTLTYGERGKRRRGVPFFCQTLCCQQRKRVAEFNK